MNIENIGILNDSLLALGFKDTILQQLIRNISFKIPDFIIRQRLFKENDVLNFHLAFEINRSGDSYSCVYYDATFRKEIEIADAKIKEIEVRELDQRMSRINWTNAFGNENRKWKIEDKASCSEEEKVESIVTDLQRLASLEEGKEIANRLKIKHWYDTPLEELFSDLRSLRTRFEISQRFYFFDRQGGISVEEAYRFLNNRWMEKQLQAKRKQKEFSTIEEQSNDNAKVGSGRSQLQKKTRNKNNKLKI